jgi:beta-glucosidase
MKIKTLTLALLTAMCLYAQAQNLKLTPKNINKIVKAMTLEEKAHLLVGGDNFDANGKKIDYVKGVAGTTHAIPRLGIPAIVLTDGPAGVRIDPERPVTSQTYYATGFPVATALACTWNTDLVSEVGKAMGNEVLEYGCDVLLAPGMNIHRTPLCGRNFEYFSEDPVLSGNMAAAYVNGVQSNGVGTSIKHFVANCQETNRINVDEVMTQRTLREIFLRGFEIAVKKSSPWTVMSSYNKVNGTWTQSSAPLLKTILRDEWGYKGIVMTDWTNERRISYERVAAGNDLLMPGHDWQETDIIEAVNDGRLSMADVDARVKGMLELIVKTPRFKGYQYSDKPNLEAHAKITRQSATEGMVLLKNDGNTLPLKSKGSVALFGSTSYDFIGGGTGSGDVHKPYVVDLKTGLTNAGFIVNSKIADIYEGSRKFVPNRKFIRAEAAANDFAIVTIGRQAGEGRDRRIDNDFNLSREEQNVLKDICEAFHEQGKKVIVILNMGNVIETASWKQLPDAILMAWQPGQEGGNSVSDVLTGKANPSGKLSMTFPIDINDIPAIANFPSGKDDKKGDPRRNVDYTLHEEGINVGYRYFATASKPVSYPFGYGLSYTTFNYDKATVKDVKDGFKATVTITNTGDVAGKEVVQVYVSAPRGTLDKPVRELKAFGKTKMLQPGQSETLTFHVDANDLASFNDKASRWETDKGDYEVQFAASSEDIRAKAVYTQKKALTRTVNDVLKPSRAL